MDVKTMPNPDKKAIGNKNRRQHRAGTCSGRTWCFEQLESRTMLSATIGPNMDVPVHAIEIQVYQETYISPAGMFAPMEFGPQFEMCPPGMTGWLCDARWASQRTLDARRASSWSRHVGQRFVAAPALVANQSKQALRAIWPTASALVVVIYNFPVAVVNLDQHNHDAATQPAGPPPYGQQYPDTTPGGATVQIVDKGPAGVGNHSNDGYPKQTGTQPGGSAINYGWWLVTSLAGQATSHAYEGSNLVSMPPSTQCLQAYTAPVLFAISPASSQSTIATPVRDSSTAELSDDFVHLNDVPAVSDSAYSSDGAIAEQAALEEVLESLQGVDSLPNQVGDSAIANDASTTAEQDVQATDLAFATAFDLPNMDGGMLLLQAHGDANDTPINLAQVAESHPDMFNLHVGVEVSVGFYQAIDRGVEEFSATEGSTARTPTVAPVPASKPDNRLTTGRETSGRKAAGVVAASTLAGPLLWCAANKRGDDDRDAESLRDDTLAR